MGIALSFLVILAFVGIAVVVSAYNRLVLLRNRYKNAFSQIDVQLKRRYDLIPNLVESTKAYLNHERQTLEEVIASRNQAVAANQRAAQNPGEPTSMKSLIGAESVLAGSLSKLMAVVESYPDLKANQTIANLTEELTSTENKVAFSRQAYNDAVTSYNTGIEVFPNSMIANSFNFHEAQLFEIEKPEERQVPKVAFG